jgi:hypothetical protein
LAAAAEDGDLLPGVGVGNDGTDGDGHDVDQEVFLAAVEAGIGQTQVSLEADRDNGHASPP